MINCLGNFVLKMMKNSIVCYSIRKLVVYLKVLVWTVFIKLFDSMLQFFVNRNETLRQNLLDYKNDTAYSTDLLNKSNEMNLQLEGDDLNLIKTSLFLRL